MTWVIGLYKILDLAGSGCLYRINSCSAAFVITVGSPQSLLCSMYVRSMIVELSWNLSCRCAWWNLFHARSLNDCFQMFQNEWVSCLILAQVSWGQKFGRSSKNFCPTHPDPCFCAHCLEGVGLVTVSMHMTCHTLQIELLSCLPCPLGQVCTDLLGGVS